MDKHISSEAEHISSSSLYQRAQVDEHISSSSQNQERTSTLVAVPYTRELKWTSILVVVLKTKRGRAHW